jgi:hypothetical protein
MTDISVANFPEAFSKRVRLALERASVDNDKDALRVLVEEFHSTVSWANQVPRVQDTAQPNVGTGLAIYYPHPDGDVRLIMLEAHKIGRHDNVDAKVQIPGGFMSFAKEATARDPVTGKMTLLTGDGFVSPKPEQQRAAVRRESDEELRGKDGPLLDIDPNRYFKLDQFTFVAGPNAMMVNGYAVELTPEEFDFIETLISESDGSQFIFSKDNEIRTAHIMKLDDLMAKPHRLAHPDQLSLFRNLKAYIEAPDDSARLDLLHRVLG